MMAPKFVALDHNRDPALQYAEACLKQGMTYASAAQATGLNEIDLRARLPGHGNVLRQRPGVEDASPFTRCAVILPQANARDLRKTIALAMAMLADKEGRDAVVNVTNNIIAALPHPAGLPLGTRVSGHDIAKHIASHFGIGWAEFISPRRTYRVVRPRQLAMYAMLILAPHLSTPAIGRILGGRDHTTVLSGIERVKTLMARHPAFKQEAEVVMRSLRDRFAAELDYAA